MRLLGLLVAATAVFFFTYKEPIQNVWHFVTLFKPDYITENFRSAAHWRPHKIIKRNTQLEAPLGNAEQLPLPRVFIHDGEEFAMEEFLEHHWSTGLVILKIDEDGSFARVLHERYWRGNNRSSRSISWSVGKSFVSTAVGIALEKGMISSLEDSVDLYVPKLKGTGYEGVSLKNVLQMSSGVGFDENYFSLLSDINVMGFWLSVGWNIDDFVVRLKREREPGTYNHYVSIDTQVLGLVIAAAAKQPLSSFLEEHIWSKVGFEDDATFLIDNVENYIELSFGTLSLRTRDFARFGWLMLNGGVNYQGDHVVSKKWVQDATTPDAPHLMPGADQKNMSQSQFFGYGYQWWIPPSAADPFKPSRNFWAQGIYNQFIGVFPEQRIVIAKNSAWPGFNTKTLWSSSIQTYKAFLTIANAFANQ